MPRSSSEPANKAFSLVTLPAMVENIPIPAVRSVVRWRTIDLCRSAWDEFRISTFKQALSRELRRMG